MVSTVSGVVDGCVRVACVVAGIAQHPSTRVPTIIYVVRAMCAGIAVCLQRSDAAATHLNSSRSSSERVVDPYRSAHPIQQAHAAN